MRDLNSTLLYNWFEEVWNRNDENAIDKLMTEDAAFSGIETGEGAKGASGFKLFFRDFTKQFHDINIVVEQVVSENDMESARTVIYATHAESGRSIVVPGICMIRVSNGKIAEAWNNYDFLSLSQQIGQKLVPA